jgi:hypothetical protein
MAVVRDDELIRDFVADGIARAAPPQHDRTLDRVGDTTGEPDHANLSDR